MGPTDDVYSLVRVALDPTFRQINTGQVELQLAITLNRNVDRIKHLVLLIFPALDDSGIDSRSGIARSGRNHQADLRRLRSGGSSLKGDSNGITRSLEFSKNGSCLLEDGVYAL